MALQIGPFPSQVNVGAIHFDTVGKGWWRFLGGNPFNPLSWLLIGGTLSEHPDTTGWGMDKTGASWTLASDGLVYGWNGNSIVLIGGQRGEGSVETFVWLPNGSGPGVYQTWESLYQAYRSSKAVKRVIDLPDSSATYIIPSGMWVFDGLTVLNGNEILGSTVNIANGASVIDLVICKNVTLFGNSTTVPPLRFGGNTFGMKLEASGIVSGTTVPVMNITNDGFGIDVWRNSILGAHALNVVSGVTCVVSLLDQTSSIDGAQDGTGTLLITRENEDNVVNVTGFGGTVTISFPGNAQRVGSTSQRPTNSVPDGHMFFDVTLGKPIWKKNAAATKWVDATGASV